jgi:hypothetical protein
LFHFGFMETPDVMEGLKLACLEPELRGIDPHNITYYCSSLLTGWPLLIAVTLRATRAPKVLQWQGSNDLPTWTDWQQVPMLQRSQSLFSTGVSGSGLATNGSTR